MTLRAVEVKDSSASPLADSPIKWHQSKTKKTFWANNCDFVEKTNQSKSPMKVEECVKFCEEDETCTHFTW
jgi:hypothetical protein